MRGVYGFRIDGVEKVTYNHSDSDPDGLGRQIIEWARHTPLAHQHKIARALILVPLNGTPTPEQVAECRPWAAKGLVGTGQAVDWHNLLREAQGRPEAWDVGLRYMTDARRRLHDPNTDAEWGYVLDLDQETLDVYASKLPRFELVRLVQWRLDALPPTDAAVRQLAQQERDG